MVKKIIFFLTFVIALCIISIMTGFYPVAVVDKGVIFRRDWQKAEAAEKQFTTIQASSINLKPINFSSPANKVISESIKKSTLTFLIEDKIIEQEGERVVEHFNDLSKKRAEDALRGEDDLAKAVKTVYTLTLQDFQRLVLMPQARRDVLKIFLAQSGKDIDEWLQSKKSSKKIELMFIPFRWNGETVN